MHPVLFLRIVVRKLFKNTFIGKVLQEAFTRPATGVIHLVCATRKTRDAFWKDSALGKSLIPYKSDPQLQLHIHFENTMGLPSVYNPYLISTPSRDLLLLVHDDIWLDTSDWMERLRRGLGRFDIVGVAGNTRLSPNQPAWLFKSISNGQFVWDNGFLSGEVAHGKWGKGQPQRYGPMPAECQVLDGVLLGMRCRSVRRARLEFDEQFKFHFYDMDLCRSASKAGLTLGTWPFPMTHQSQGSFGGPDWQVGYKKYLAKWNPN